MNINSVDNVAKEFESLIKKLKDTYDSLETKSKNLKKI